MTADQPSPSQQIFDTLTRLGINYEAMRHDPIFTMAEGVEIARRLNVTPCKNLLLCNRFLQFFLVLTLGDKRVSMKEIAAQINSPHLSFATDEQLDGLLHCGQGCVTPLGLLYDIGQKVQLLIDRDVLALTDIGCHPCINSCSVRLGLKDLLETFLPHTSHSYKVLDL